MTALRIERLCTLAQYEQCVAIQSATWNYSSGELFPRRAFLLADKLGGHVLGAFDGDALVAFNVAFPGHRAGHSYLHSQMLAVLPPYRNHGAGRALKLAQRAIAIAEGFDLIEWTYDPLEIKNAFFNLHRLGAITRRYVRDFYGPSSSPLQGGLPTDRLYAEWWVRSAHATRALDQAEFCVVPAQTVTIDGNIYDWKAAGDQRAGLTQSAVRSLLEEAFAAGLVAADFTRAADGSGTYQLVPGAAKTVGATEWRCPLET